jgi:hypothetical protein
MYTVYFLIGFMSSFGWWSASKIQKAIDGEPAKPAIVMEQKEK